MRLRMLPAHPRRNLMMSCSRNIHMRDRLIAPVADQPVVLVTLRRGIVAPGRSLTVSPLRQADEGQSLPLLSSSALIH